MEQQDLAYFKAWFENYVAKFYASVDNDKTAILLKEDHTRRTCREIVLLGSELGLTWRDLLLAETAALFHDVGRFLQWKQYGTFFDGESEDHGLLGVKELSRYQVLSRISAAERQVIEQSILYHNQKELPREIAPRSVFFTKLLRDADKLDIWRLAIQLEHNENRLLERALKERLPRTPACSHAIIADLKMNKTSDFSYVRSQNDLKLFRLGWVFDLNFIPTCRQVLKRHYIEQLCSQLPQTKEIQELQQDLLSHLRTRAESDCVENKHLVPL